MLEFDDIQHILLTRAPALTGRYEFLSFRDAAAGARGSRPSWTRCSPAQSVRATVDSDDSAG